MTITDYRKTAKKIVQSGKPAKIIWNELKNWASGKGPIAMKAAVMEFVHSYHNSSDLHSMLPELMRSSQFTPYEQKALIELVDHKPDLIENRIALSGSKHLLPVASSRPELSLSFNPSDKSMLLHPNLEDPRNLVLNMREKSRISLARPNVLEGRPNKMDHSSIQTHSLSFESKSHGEHLVRNLVEHVKFHGASLMHPISSKVKSKVKKVTVKKSLKKIKNRKKR